MSGLIPIPNTRVSGLLGRQRLLGQLQNDQLALFRLQDQVSTGRRIQLPSEDAPSALRAVTLQRLMERKSQIATNLESGQLYLAATDNALNDVAALLGDLRGAALGVADTVSTAEEREAVAAEVDRAIEQLVRIGNTQFRGRYLFAGSQTNVTPYVMDGNLVRFDGNEKEVHNYSDVDVLFSTNAPGDNVFGGLSTEVLGGVDLNPEVKSDTLLSSLRGGEGISPNGALAISDGSSTSIVDISGASDVGDLVRLIESNPPSGRVIAASITGQGISLQLDGAGGGNLTVTEVASGTAAQELGILEETGVLTAPLVGGDLNPALQKTSRLADLLGTKATARLTSAGDNNDLLLTANVNGTQLNGATIQIVDHDLLAAAPGITQGNEYAEFDPAPRAATASLELIGADNDLLITANTPGSALNDVRIFIVGQTGLGNAALANYDTVNQRLTITIDDAGATSAQEFVNAVNGTGVFTATPDSSVEPSFNPAGLVQAVNIANVTGDTGKSGGDANTLYVYAQRNASTANDAIAAINAEGTYTAQVDPLDTGILAQAGTGLLSVGASAAAAGGSGSTLDLAGGLHVSHRGNVYQLDFSSAETVEDLLNEINGSEAGLLAEINADQTGINIRSRLSGSDLRIAENGGTTAADLGVRTLTTETRLEALNYGVGVFPGVGTDFTIISQDAGGVDVSFGVDVSSAETIGDVIDLINAHPTNNSAGVAVLARLRNVGGGIELVDQNPTGSGTLTIDAQLGSQAAQHLGLIPAGATQVIAAGGTISGEDRHYIENESVYSTLIRLRDALASGDIEAMERAIGKIDDDLNRAVSARSDVGARQRALDITQTSLEDEDVQLRSALSEELDVDLVEAISNLTARQISMQASLQASASLLRVSLLDFL